jgi:hypothetical protein
MEVSHDGRKEKSSEKTRQEGSKEEEVNGL